MKKKYSIFSMIRPKCRPQKRLPKTKKEEVYLPISRWRAENGEPYVYINDLGNVVMGLDLRWGKHNERYDNGNYFKSYKAAYESK